MTEDRGQRTEGRGRWVTFCLLFSVLCLLMTGCGPEWKKKFIRKKKNAPPPQPIFVLQSDVQATHPPDVRYQEHFAYWKSWQSELLNSLGKTRKRDLRYLDGVIGELRAMRELLTGPPADRLKEILIELSRLQESWIAAEEPWPSSSATRSRLQQLLREVDRDLHFSKVKEWIPSGQGSLTSS